MSKNEIVQVFVVVIRKTDKAMLVKNDLCESVWIPRSMIYQFMEAKNSDKYVGLDIPRWLAKNKGLI